MKEQLTYQKARELAGPTHEAVADVVFAVATGEKNFFDACDDQNLYGDRADIVAEREHAALILARLGIKITRF